MDILAPRRPEVPRQLALAARYKHSESTIFTDLGLTLRSNCTLIWFDKVDWLEVPDNIHFLRGAAAAVCGTRHPRAFNKTPLPIHQHSIVEDFNSAYFGEFFDAHRPYFLLQQSAHSSLLSKVSFMKSHLRLHYNVRNCVIFIIEGALALS